MKATQAQGVEWGEHYRRAPCRPSRARPVYLNNFRNARPVALPAAQRASAEFVNAWGGPMGCRRWAAALRVPACPLLDRLRQGRSAGPLCEVCEAPG